MADSGSAQESDLKQAYEAFKAQIAQFIRSADKSGIQRIKNINELQIIRNAFNTFKAKFVEALEFISQPHILNLQARSKNEQLRKDISAIFDEALNLAQQALQVYDFNLKRGTEPNKAELLLQAAGPEYDFLKNYLQGLTEGVERRSLPKVITDQLPALAAASVAATPFSASLEPAAAPQYAAGVVSAQSRRASVVVPASDAYTAGLSQPPAPLSLSTMATGTQRATTREREGGGAGDEVDDSEMEISVADHHIDTGAAPAAGTAGTAATTQGVGEHPDEEGDPGVGPNGGNNGGEGEPSNKNTFSVDTATGLPLHQRQPSSASDGSNAPQQGPRGGRQQKLTPKPGPSRAGTPLTSSLNAAYGDPNATITEGYLRYLQDQMVGEEAIVKQDSVAALVTAFQQEIDKASTKIAQPPQTSKQASFQEVYNPTGVPEKKVTLEAVGNSVKFIIPDAAGFTLNLAGNPPADPTKPKPAVAADEEISVTFNSLNPSAREIALASAAMHNALAMKGKKPDNTILEISNCSAETALKLYCTFAGQGNKVEFGNKVDFKDSSPEKSLRDLFKTLKPSSDKDDALLLLVINRSNNLNAGDDASIISAILADVKAHQNQYTKADLKTFLTHSSVLKRDDPTPQPKSPAAGATPTPTAPAPAAPGAPPPAPAVPPAQPPAPAPPPPPAAKP